MDIVLLFWYNVGIISEGVPGMNDITYVGRHTTASTAARHHHECWEFVYCTAGGGAFAFGDRRIGYREGDVVVIPPMSPHINSPQPGVSNIHVSMDAPILTFKEPTLIQDTADRFLLHAFNMALHHFYHEGKERFALLSCYGSLICHYLIAYQTGHQRSDVVEEIEYNILTHYTDCDYKLDAYFAGLPFSDGYLRKLFQKEFGVTPHQFLNNKRLQMAAEALADNNGYSIGEIAQMCGFRDQLYFSKLFKRMYGVAPSAFVTRETGK